MTPHRRQQLERLLRYARQNVDDRPRLERTIKLCCNRLRGKHHNPYDNPSKAHWAETMWR